MFTRNSPELRSSMSLAMLMVLAGMACGLSHTALGQVETQTIDLRPGWNAIFPLVTPADNKPDVVFSNPAIKSVWAWNKKAETIEFIDDPVNLKPDDPDWLVYIADNGNAGEEEKNALSSLYAVFAGRAYLVEVAGTQNISVELMGRPTIRETTWIPDSYNLCGFHTSGTAAPTFNNFLPASPSPVEKVFKLAANGTWVQVTPSTDTVQRGVAYWFYVNDKLSYEGPTTISTEFGDSLSFGDTLDQLFVTITNQTTQPTTVQLAIRASEEDPSPGDELVVGAVPLEFYEFDAATETSQWSSLAQGASYEIPPKGEVVVRLAPRRDLFTPSVAGSPGEYQKFASLMEITDNRGMKYVLPVEALSPAGQGAAKSTSTQHGGLWVGYATLDKVSEPESNREGHDPDEPVDADSTFQFPLIIHIDETGEVNLLQEVIQVWKPAVVDQVSGEILEKASYVHLPSLESASEFEGVGSVDNKDVSRRISSAAFVFPWDPIAGKRSDRMSMVGSTETTLTCTIDLPHNDPLNPFVHQFHPDHDNLDARYETPVNESFNIVRDISLEFDDAAILSDEPLDRTNQLFGKYTETVRNVHRRPVFVEGRFALRRVSREMNQLP